jgi:hypothetical protein
MDLLQFFQLLLLQVEEVEQLLMLPLADLVDQEEALQEKQMVEEYYQVQDTQLEQVTLRQQVLLKVIVEVMEVQQVDLHLYQFFLVEVEEVLQ